MIEVISTGFRAVTKQRCLDSVARQKCRSPFKHTYIEASEQDPPKPAMQNLWEFVTALPRDAIVAHLDGDDELARDDALDIVAAQYEDPDVWLTYGSQRIIDGTHSQACHRVKLPDDGDVRVLDCPSHLKTYRAGLFHHLDADFELKHKDGRWRDYFRCGAELLPMLELCGPKHRRYIPEVLVLYHYELSENKRMTPHEEAIEHQEARDVRALPRRHPLVAM